MKAAVGVHGLTAIRTGGLPRREALPRAAAHQAQHRKPRNVASTGRAFERCQRELVRYPVPLHANRGTGPATPPPRHLRAATGRPLSARRLGPPVRAALATCLALAALAGPAHASTDPLEWTAPLEAAVSAAVYALTAGPVREVRVREGDRVARGDTLVVLEYADLRLAAARARLACQRTQGYLNRAVPLHARGGVSTQELETLRYEAEAAQLRLEQAELDLSRTVLCAPMAGQVAECTAQIGRPTTAGQVLLVLIDPTDLKADLYLPATQLSQVRLHQVLQAVSVNAPAAGPGRPIPGRVVHISPILDPHSGQARVRLLFAQAGRYHRPGTLVRVQLKGE